MSECLKFFLLSKKSNKMSPKVRQKQAEKKNYAFMNCISFNLIDNMTKFKNNEINKSNLYLKSFINLSLFLLKEKIEQKKIKNKLEKNNMYINNNNKKKKLVKKCYVKNFGIYFPTKRITFL